MARANCGLQGESDVAKKLPSYGPRSQNNDSYMVKSNEWPVLTMFQKECGNPQKTSKRASKVEIVSFGFPGLQDAHSTAML